MQINLIGPDPSPCCGEPYSMSDLERPILSKSTFLRGLQCEKSLYLYKNFYTHRDPIPKERQAAFDRGNRIGEFAHQLFPGGIDCKPASPRQSRKALEKTQELLAAGQEVIYEAAFAADRVLIYVDILVKKDDGWYAYEVKSSTRVSPVHVIDASLQYYVLEKSGISLQDFNLVYVDTSYVRQGEIDPQQLFKFESVKREVLTNWDFVEMNVKRLMEVLQEIDIPEKKIGPQCSEPYDCDFRGTCWKGVPDRPVIELGGMPKKELFELYHMGIRQLTDIGENIKLSPEQRLVVNAEKSGKPIINEPAIKAFLDNLNYPLLLVDFESFMPPIPRYDGTRPYQQLPFLYSAHRIESPGMDATATDFLAEPGKDPRAEVLEAFLKQQRVKVTSWPLMPVWKVRPFRSLSNLTQAIKKPLLNV